MALPLELVQLIDRPLPPLLLGDCDCDDDGCDVDERDLGVCSLARSSRAVKAGELITMPNLIVLCVCQAGLADKAPSKARKRNKVWMDESEPLPDRPPLVRADNWPPPVFLVRLSSQPAQVPITAAQGSGPKGEVCFCVTWRAQLIGAFIMALVFVPPTDRPAGRRGQANIPMPSECESKPERESGGQQGRKAAGSFECLNGRGADNWNSSL